MWERKQVWNDNGLSLLRGLPLDTWLCQWLDRCLVVILTVQRRTTTLLHFPLCIICCQISQWDIQYDHFLSVSVQRPSILSQHIWNTDPKTKTIRLQGTVHVFVPLCIVVTREKMAYVASHMIFTLFSFIVK